MEQFPGKPEKSEKELQLEATRNKVERIADGLGMGIDENIKDTISLLMTMGFETSSSCGGHTGTEEEHGRIRFPYVTFYTEEPEGWEEDSNNKELVDLWRHTNNKQRTKFNPFLEEFNGLIEDEDLKFTIKEIGVFGGFMIKSNGALDIEALKKLTKEQVIEKIKQYQGVMNEFTEYLNSKYFSEPK